MAIFSAGWDSACPRSGSEGDEGRGALSKGGEVQEQSGRVIGNNGESGVPEGSEGGVDVGGGGGRGEDAWTQGRRRGGWVGEVAGGGAIEQVLDGGGQEARELCEMMRVIGAARVAIEAQREVDVQPVPRPGQGHVEQATLLFD
jgi:hypothetical protein